MLSLKFYWSNQKMSATEPTYVELKEVLITREILASGLRSLDAALPKIDLRQVAKQQRPKIKAEYLFAFAQGFNRGCVDAIDDLLYSGFEWG
jgi:hypothetical protein